MRIRYLLPLMLLVGSNIARASNIRLTISSAKIEAAKIPKHDHPTSNAHLSDLACLSTPGLRAIPNLCGTAGAMTADIKGGAPVDAFVRVEIGEHVLRTYPIPGQLLPKWEYSVILDRAFLDTPDFANFILYDYDGPGAERKLGDKLVKTRELLKPGTRTLTGVGGHALTIKIEALPDGAAPRSYKFRVPADQQMADLARNAKVAMKPEGEGYVVIPLAEGEEVEVNATGKVQPSAKKHPDRVAGPNGIPTIQTKIQFNQPGFRGCPGCDHAALIGNIGSKGFVVGAHKKFTVENSGLFVLAINDLKVSDNAGAFDVQVVVTLPASSSGEARAPSKKKGSAADSGPSGIDPRVVQQIVDSHGEELDACASKEPNPYGEVILQFSISADGSLLGVIVEKASPNLKSAGECMRQHALKWRFPPPRGVVTARYPVSFSAS
jgi:hypothetical protein